MQHGNQLADVSIAQSSSALPRNGPDRCQSHTSITEREDAIRNLPWTHTKNGQSAGQMKTQSACREISRCSAVPDVMQFVDCKLLTTPICSGLQQYSVSCIHPVQRCVSTRHMTTTFSRLKPRTLLSPPACLATRASD